MIESKSIVEFSKKYFNLNSNRKIATNYNLVGLKFLDEKSIIRLQNKDGYGFSPFEDENGNNIEFEFKERPIRKNEIKLIKNNFFWKVIK